MENHYSREFTTADLEDDHVAAAEKTRVTAADMQRAHTRVAARLGDVACEDRDTIAVEFELDD